MILPNKLMEQLQVQVWTTRAVSMMALMILLSFVVAGCKSSSTQAENAQGNGAAASLAPAPAPPTLDVPAGTALAIRLNQHISVKGSRAGDQFTGTIAEPVMANNAIAIPEGSSVVGVVDVSHRRGHFKGRSELALRLTSMTVNGKTYSLDTRDNVHDKSGKGRRSAAIIGGTSGAGMLIGGVATGGVGLVIGGLAGAGAGTGIAGLTGNRDINLPAESVVHFRLAEDLSVQ
jgi:hypothetical protein